MYNREVSTEECFHSYLIEIMLQMREGIFMQHDNLRTVDHPSRVEEHEKPIKPKSQHG